MKKIILLSLLLVATNAHSLGVNTQRSNVLKAKFDQLKTGEILKAEFIDFINNQLHHPLVDVYQDKRGVYQWIVSNDKFLTSRGISSVENFK